MASPDERAFPVSVPVQGYGMKLRDYFAAKAMQAIIERMPQMPNDRIADQAYGLADAMLARRESD